MRLPRRRASQRELGPVRDKRPAVDRKTRAKTAIARAIFMPPALALELFRRARARLRLSLFGQRYRLIELVQDGSFSPPPGKPRVLVVITHVATQADLADEARRADKADKLRRTIDGALASFAHCELELVLNTVPGMHTASSLPDYQRRRLAVREREVDDPMFAGFGAHEELARGVEEFDWFVYSEDDMILEDSSFLDKLTFFNRHAGERAVLIPHPYEMREGAKFYVNFRNDDDWAREGLWNRLSVLTFGSVKFAEFQNPHAGFFCLSQAQLRDWLASGRHWHGKVTYVASRESAATGSLFERFVLYKPHPANLHFLEIRHWDTKYARMIEAALDDARA